MSLDCSDSSFSLAQEKSYPVRAAQVGLSVSLFVCQFVYHFLAGLRIQDTFKGLLYT